MCGGHGGGDGGESVSTSLAWACTVLGDQVRSSASKAVRMSNAEFCLNIIHTQTDVGKSEFPRFYPLMFTPCWDK